MASVFKLPRWSTPNDLAGSLIVWRHAAAFVLLLAAALTAQAGPANDPRLQELLSYARPGQVFQMALEARSVKDYPEMMYLLRRAAKAGDRDAQELLGGILLVGPSVYGKGVKANPCEAAHWIGRAREQGSVVAENQSLVLNNLFAMPNRWASCKAMS